MVYSHHNLTHFVYSSLKEIKPSVMGAPVYAYSEAFEMYSGWFKPSVNEVSSVEFIIHSTCTPPHLYVE